MISYHIDNIMKITKEKISRREPIMLSKMFGSKCLDYATYDPESKELIIEFTNGRCYKYENVPHNVYDALVAAKSAGRFFNKSIRDVYNSSKM